ncbi:MAG: F0F1 ATP synthase subunit delta, partial [Oscillospiraceae bacterium]|nr:F0F1 ATP synthase subunit delta [Oscillospiraceae bacterium]
RYFGKKMILNEHIDPRVLGGVKLVCGGEMLDGTLRSRLDSMKDMITDNMTIGR